MRPTDYRLYVFEVERTEFFRIEDYAGDFLHWKVIPRQLETVRLLGPAHKEEVMKAILIDRYKYAGIEGQGAEPKILSIAELQIDGIMEIHQ